MLSSQPGQSTSKMAKDAKEAKQPLAPQQTPNTVLKYVLTKTGMLLTEGEIAILKSLNLPKGRHHRREINALLREHNIHAWMCPYSIIRGNGMHGEGDGLYAIYRNPIEDKPVVIGKGGTAQVKNVQNLDTGEWPVLKVVAHFDEFAVNEYQLLQELGKADSHLIQKISKNGVNKREILMKRANGVSLYELLAHGQLPTDATLLKKIAINILRELQKIHDQGIILRDIKHENIMVDPETGEVTLIDFGFALKATNGVASDGELRGTVQYVPHDMILKNNTNYSFATDMYAAGIVLHGLLTGNILLHTTAKGLDYTDQYGFYICNDGIQRTVKQGDLTIPYVVEQEIANIINSLKDIGSEKPPSLEEACKTIEKYIPIEQRTKVSDPKALVSQQGMFKGPTSNTAENKPVASVSRDEELERMLEEQFGVHLKDIDPIPMQPVKNSKPAACVHISYSDGPYLHEKELEARQNKPGTH